MIKFSDLHFEIHPIMNHYSKTKMVAMSLRKENISTRAEIELPNNYIVSIVNGSLFYSDGLNTYEAMIIYGAKNKDSDPKGHLNKKQLMKYLNKIARRKLISKRVN